MSVYQLLAAHDTARSCKIIVKIYWQSKMEELRAAGILPGTRQLIARVVNNLTLTEMDTVSRCFSYIHVLSYRILGCFACHLKGGGYPLKKPGSDLMSNPEIQ
jgi:hypothetical protein